MGEGYLSLAGSPGVGSIYGMSTLPAARGRGVAGAVASALVDRAFAEGCRRVVLHSSDMAARLYRSLGFVEHCMRPVYATAAVVGRALSAAARRQPFVPPSARRR